MKIERMLIPQTPRYVDRELARAETEKRGTFSNEAVSLDHERERKRDFSEKEEKEPKDNSNTDQGAENKAREERHKSIDIIA